MWSSLQALNERKVEIRVQYKPPVQLAGATVSLNSFRNELVMRCAFDAKEPRHPCGLISS